MVIHHLNKPSILCIKLSGLSRLFHITAVLLTAKKSRFEIGPQGNLLDLKIQPTDEMGLQKAIVIISRDNNTFYDSHHSSLALKVY